MFWPYCYAFKMHPHATEVTCEHGSAADDCVGCEFVFGLGFMQGQLLGLIKARQREKARTFFKNLARWLKTDPKAASRSEIS